MIGHTNRQTNRDFYFIYIQKDDNQFCVFARSPSVLPPTLFYNIVLLGLHLCFLQPYSTILYYQVSICANSNLFYNIVSLGLHLCFLQPYSTLLYYQVSICVTSNPILQYCIIGSPSVLPPSLFYNIVLSGLHLCFLQPPLQYYIIRPNNTRLSAFLEELHSKRRFTTWHRTFQSPM